MMTRHMNEWFASGSLSRDAVSLGMTQLAVINADPEEVRTTERNPMQLGVLGLLIAVAGLGLGSPGRAASINPVPFMAFLSLAPGTVMVVAALAWRFWRSVRKR
jgi:hypothetical protein